MALFGDWSRGDIFADDGWMGGVRDNKGVHADVRNGKTYGTFWKGSDGKVYVAGENGVNSAGSWDTANTIPYWVNQGYGYQSDPNRRQTGGHRPDDNSSPTQNLQLGVYGGGGGNRASASQLAEYQEGIDQANHNMGRIDSQLGIRRQNINDDYRKKSDALESSFARQKNVYDTQRTQNLQQRRNDVNAINDKSSADLRGLLSLLGARGANGSDIEKVARAVQDQATRERSGSGMEYAKNAQELDTNWHYFQQDTDKERKALNDWKVNEERAAQRDAETQRQGLHTLLAQLRRQQAEARGANGANAARADLARSRELSSSIDNLGRLQTTHTGKDVVYKPASLDSYKLEGNTEVRVGDTTGAAGDNSVNIYNTRQTEEDRKKRNGYL